MKASPVAHGAASVPSKLALEDVAGAVHGSRVVRPIDTPSSADDGILYLDYHATTPCDPRVVEEMLPCFSETYGNPASPHPAGRLADARVDLARQRVAALLGCEPSEIVFTSGASESNNLAIKGAAEADPRGRRHLVTAVTEHKAVLDVMARLARRGFDVTYLPVEADGRVLPEAVAKALRPDTLMVSLMLANNEIGVLHPIVEIAALCRQRGVLTHCDAAQALAHVDCSIPRLGVDLLSISGHKAYGPKGVGALFVRRKPRVRLIPRIEGGGQEKGRRSGTLNVPGIVGLGKACQLVGAERDADARRSAELRDRLLGHLRQGAPDLRIHGSMEHRLPNNLNVSFPGVEGQQLLSHLDRVAISSGAACSSPTHDGSYVLKALPGAGEGATGSLRCGLGRFSHRREVDAAAREILGAVEACRQAPATHDDSLCGVSC